MSNGKNLYIFRDSFGSAMAPLLVGGYEEVYLIDLRYVKSDYLDSFVTLDEGNDILFLYSTHIINQSDLIQ